MKKTIISATTSLLIALTFIITNLPVDSAADAQATLRWDESSTPPQGYRLYQRTEGQPYNDSQYVDTGSSTSQTVYGLAENTTYFFVVRAYAGSEISNASNEVSFISDGNTPGDTNPPNQPFAVSPDDNAQDIALQAELRSSEFYDPDTNDQHAETRWQIHRLDDDSLVLDITSGESLTQLTVPSSVLEPFTTYYWTVSYTNQKGATSIASPRAYFTTIMDQTPTTPPSSNLGNDSGSGGGGGGLGAGCLIQTLSSSNP